MHRSWALMGGSSTFWRGPPRCRCSEPAVSPAPSGASTWAPVAICRKRATGGRHMSIPDDAYQSRSCLHPAQLALRLLPLPLLPPSLCPWRRLEQSPYRPSDGPGAERTTPLPPDPSVLAMPRKTPPTPTAPSQSPHAAPALTQSSSHCARSAFQPFRSGGPATGYGVHWEGRRGGRGWGGDRVHAGGRCGEVRLRFREIRRMPGGGVSHGPREGAGAAGDQAHTSRPQP